MLPDVVPPIDEAEVRVRIGTRSRESLPAVYIIDATGMGVTRVTKGGGPNSPAHNSGGGNRPRLLELTQFLLLRPIRGTRRSPWPACSRDPGDARNAKCSGNIYRGIGNCLATHRIFLAPA